MNTHLYLEFRAFLKLVCTGKSCDILKWKSALHKMFAKYQRIDTRYLFSYVRYRNPCISVKYIVWSNSYLALKICVFGRINKSLFIIDSVN